MAGPINGLCDRPMPIQEDAMSSAKIHKYQIACNATKSQVKAIDDVAVVDEKKAAPWADFFVVTVAPVDWDAVLEQCEAEDV